MYTRSIGRMVYMNLSTQLLCKLKDKATKALLEQRRRSDERVVETHSLKKTEKKGIKREKVPDERKSDNQSPIVLARSLPLLSSVQESSRSVVLLSPSCETDDSKTLEPRPPMSDGDNPSTGFVVQGFYSKPPTTTKHDEEVDKRREASECRPDAADNHVVKKRKKKKPASFESALGRLDRRILQTKKNKLSLPLAADSSGQTSSEGFQDSTGNRSLLHDRAQGKKSSSTVRHGKVRPPSSLLLLTQRPHTPTLPYHSQPSLGVKAEKEDSSAPVPAFPPPSFAPLVNLSVIASKKKQEGEKGLANEHVGAKLDRTVQRRTTSCVLPGRDKARPKPSYSILKKKEVVFNG